MVSPATTLKFGSCRTRAPGAELEDESPTNVRHEQGTAIDEDQHRAGEAQGEDVLGALKEAALKVTVSLVVEYLISTKSPLGEANGKPSEPRCRA